MPDLLTTANLCCGTASLLLAAEGEWVLACWLLFLAALFDVFDGLAARALGGGSELGKQLDSLADLVSFGVAPAFAAWSLFTAGPGLAGPRSTWWLGGAVMAICTASAWRLAKFNVDTRQSHGFLGLATPANGLFWASAVLAISGSGITPWAEAWGAGRWLAAGPFAHPWMIFALAMLLGALMVSEWPLPSLKFKHGGWKGNEAVFVLLGIGAALVLAFGILAVPLLLILYVTSPIWGKLFPKTT